MVDRHRIESLEPRRHLAVTALPDFGGLPRELTQVHDTLYFALDSKVDGYLTYVDLVGYNLETGTRTSIRREDGKAFGKTQYFLSKADDRLLIAEQFGTRYAPDYELWTCTRGETRATRLLPGRVTALPTFVRSSGGLFFTASPSEGTEGIYRLGRTGQATLAYAASSFGVMSGIASFGGGLAVFGGATAKHPARATTLYVGSGLPGTLRQVKTLPSGIGNFNGFGAGGYLVVTASFKDRTAVYSSVDASSWSPLTAHPSARYTNARVLAPSAAQAILLWSVGSSDTPQPRRVNLKTGATFAVENSNLQYRHIGGSLYGFNYEAAPFDDPEAKGGYVAPGGGSGSFARNDVSDGWPGVFRRIDLRTDADVTLPNLSVPYLGSSTVRDELRAAGGFVQAGDLVYFIRSTTSTAYPASAKLWLCSTDGTAAGTMYYGNVIAAPVAWKDRIFTLNAPTSTTLYPMGYRQGAIEGRVVIDPRNARTFNESMTPLRGRRVFIDTNNNGKYDKPWEPATLTDASGYYRFDQVYATSRTVCLTPEPGWEATRGWSRTVTVQHGHARTVWFGLKDVVQSGVINGYYGSAFSTTVAYLDTNRNDLLDPGERTSTFSLVEGRYRCQFTSVRAGNYVLRFYRPDYDEDFGYATDAIVSAGQIVNVGPRV